MRTHLSPLRQQFRNRDEGVADHIEQKVGGDSGETPVFRLAPGAVLLAPSKPTLDHFAFARRSGAALVPGGSSVDGRLARPSGLRAIRIDGNVRCDVLRPQAFQVRFKIIGFVRADRDACMWQSFLPQHLLQCRAFRRTACLCDEPRDGQAVPVFDRGVPHVAKCTLLPLALAVEAAVGMGRAFMRIVLACRESAPRRRL